MIRVYHKDTGQEKMMGEVQFKLLGKNSKWTEKPVAKKPENKNETTVDAKNETKKDVSKSSANGTIVEAVPFMQKFGEAGDLDGLIAYVGEDTRGGIVTALEKIKSQIEEAAAEEDQGTDQGAATEEEE